MPGRIDGFALARALREKDPALPVLLVTGYADASREARDEFIDPAASPTTCTSCARRC